MYPFERLVEIAMKYSAQSFLYPAKWIAALCLCFWWLSVHAAQPAGMVVNSEIHTMDSDQTVAEAMVWDENGMLLAVGTDLAVRERFPDVQATDLQGHTIIPGLIDAHGHVMNLGLARLNADLTGSESLQEVIDRIKTHANGLPDDAWLLGRGWDQTR